MEMHHGPAEVSVLISSYLEGGHRGITAVFRFFALVPIFSKNSRGNACYGSYPNSGPQLLTTYSNILVIIANWGSVFNGEGGGAGVGCEGKL